MWRRSVLSMLRSRPYTRQDDASQTMFSCDAITSSCCGEGQRLSPLRFASPVQAEQVPWHSPPTESWLPSGARGRGRVSARGRRSGRLTGAQRAAQRAQAAAQGAWAAQRAWAKASERGGWGAPCMLLLMSISVK